MSHQDIHVYGTPGYFLASQKYPEEFSHYLVSTRQNVAYPINETAAVVWKCCRETILVSDLQNIMEKSFPDAAGISQDTKDILDQFSELGCVKYSADPCQKRHYSLDYLPEPGVQSEKAQRLVDFCLGDFKEKEISPCTRDLKYLNNKTILLLEANQGSAELSTALNDKVRDQKKIVEALISQRTNIPDNLKCWVIRGDSSGAYSIPNQGVHVAGMRHTSRRHIVLVPSACRDRYLGPNLERQMEELEDSWVPWGEKSNTAWWGGALTGDWWKSNEPRTLTRREVLYYYRDNPSDRVRLDLTELSATKSVPPGLELKDSFTKKYAFGHKCLVLLPGNDIASSSSWYFAGNSVVLMPRPHLEHILYFEMEPWEHYVPLERDPKDILVKLDWVLNNQDRARQIVKNSHERLKWLCGPEYFWACNEVLRRIANPIDNL